MPTCELFTHFVDVIEKKEKENYVLGQQELRKTENRIW